MFIRYYIRRWNYQQAVSVSL